MTSGVLAYALFFVALYLLNRWYERGWQSDIIKQLSLQSFSTFSGEIKFKNIPVKYYTNPRRFVEDMDYKDVVYYRARFTFRKPGSKWHTVKEFELGSGSKSLLRLLAYKYG